MRDEKTIPIDERLPLVTSNQNKRNNPCEPLTQAGSTCIDYTGNALRHLKQAGKTGLSYSRNTLFHIIDFFRIAFPTQLYMGQFLYRILVELDHYGDEPPLDIQETWINWSLVVASLLIALIVKSINQIKPFDESEAEELPTTQSSEPVNTYKKTINHYSAQDYVYALFSSSIVFFFFDAISSKGRVGRIGFPAFIGASAFAAALSLVFSIIALRDSTGKFVTPTALQEAPTFPEASRLEKLQNAITGASYGVNIHVLFWVFNREVYTQMEGMGWWQIAASAFWVALSSFAGYNLTSDTMRFHYVLALSKSVREISFAYLGMSVVVIQTLALMGDCVYSSCWQDSMLEHMSKVIIPVSLLIGLFSGATTLFRYDDKHKSFEEKKEMLLNSPEKIKAFSGKISNGFSSGFRFFKSCCQEDTKKLLLPESEENANSMQTR